jgi:predicted transcriptional regulator
MDNHTSTLLREIKVATQWSEPRIASEIGVSQATINRILHDLVDCKTSTTRAITALHKRVCRKRPRPVTGQQ